MALASGPPGRRLVQQVQAQHGVKAADGGQLGGVADAGLEHVVDLSDPQGIGPILPTASRKPALKPSTAAWSTSPPSFRAATRFTSLL